MANRLKFISGVVYRLKRRYGVPIQILRRQSALLNLETGIKTIVKDWISVSRAIVLPDRQHREFYYDLAFIAAAKNFTYGGHVDVTERRFIIDRKDLGAWQIVVGQWIVYQGQRYDVKEVSDFEDDRSYYILAKQSVAASPSDVVGAADDIGISDGASE